MIEDKMETTNQKISDPSIISKMTNLESRTLTNWEKDFLDSIKKFYVKNKYLSEKQFNLLLKIESQTDPTAVAEKQKADSEWRESYDDTKRQIAKVCAEYYIRTQYFNDIAVKIIKDPTHIPTEKQYKAMCENKYAKRLVENMTTQKYLPGQVVEYRKTANLGTDVGTIVEKINKIHRWSAQNGSSEYRVLWMVSGEETIVQEKQIKLYRDK